MVKNWLHELCKFDTMGKQDCTEIQAFLSSRPAYRPAYGRRAKPRRDLAPQPIGYLSRQRNVLRLVKATWLYFNTNYSWKLSWHQAAR